MKKDFTILAIDTSCDETSVAITRDNLVLTNIIASQVEFHRPYGGVWPMLAKRKHQEFIDPAIEAAFKKTRLTWSQIDCLAVTAGPGLAPALEVGIAKIKQLAQQQQKPVVAVNHMEAHLLSVFARNSKNQGAFSKTKPRFPILGLLVSGGHTQLVLMLGFGCYQLLGETLDDAVGEAFDKAAKMLELGYPGGPIISELAKKGKPKYDLPVPMLGSKDLNFSFSGLKTACLYKLQQISKPWRKQFYHDFAASFERTAVQALMIKLEKAIEQCQPKQIVLGGGVVSNLRLRAQARNTARKFGLKIFLPYSQKLFTDNAAMVGVCAFYQAQRKDFVKNIAALDRLPNLNFH